MWPPPPPSHRQRRHTLFFRLMFHDNHTIIIDVTRTLRLPVAFGLAPDVWLIDVGCPKLGQCLFDHKRLWRQWRRKQRR
jgi:hypothetical protein